MTSPVPDPRARRGGPPGSDAVAVDLAGPGPGRPVVLYHGAAGSPRVWDRVVARIREDFDVHAIDLHGDGGDSYAGPPVVVGNGVGALLAAGHAAAMAGRVRAVVMAGPIGLAGAGHARLRWLSTHRPGAAFLRVAGRTFGRATFLRDQLAHPDADPEAARILVEALRDARKFHELARLNVPGHLAPLHAIPCPVVVLWGECDGVLPITRADEFMAHLPPHARLVRVPDAGHALPLERPDLVAEVVRQLA